MSESLRNIVRLALVAAFGATTFAYGALWMAAVRFQPPVDVGATFDAATLEIVTLRPGGPAESGGLKLHDRLLALGADAVTTRVAVSDALRRAAPGDSLRFMVNLAGLNEPRAYEVVLGSPEPRPRPFWLAALLRGLAWSFPLLVLAVAATVLLERRGAPESWLLALVAAGMAATAPLVPFYEGLPPGLRGFAVAFKVLLVGAAPAFLHALLGSFGEASPVDERLPWLRRAWPLAAIGVGAPFALWSLASDGFGPTRGPWPAIGLALVVLSWSVALALGLLSLWPVRVGAPSADAARKARIVTAGIVAATLPLLLLFLAGAVTDLPLVQLSLALRLPAVLGLLLLPLACGYAVSAEPVLELPLLLRRAARTLLVGRGSRALILIGCATIAVGVADLATRPLTGALRVGVAIAAGLACQLLIVPTAARIQRRLRDRVERALFPREHETRRLLERLEEDIFEPQDARALTALLGDGLGRALEPTRIAVYVTDRGSQRLAVACGAVPKELEEIPLDRPLVPGADGHGARAIGALDRVTDLGPDCLVPIAGSRPGLLGLVVLGPRRSDEPYSGEDRRWLASVAAKAGYALERLRVGVRGVEADARRSGAGLRQSGAGGAMAGVKIKKHFQAPPEKTFRIVADFARAADRVEGIKRVEMLTPDPVGVGTRFRETRVMFGHEATEVLEVTAFDPPRSYAVGCESHGCRYRSEFRFTPSGAGTEVEMEFEATPLTFVAKAMAVAMKPMIKKLADACAQDLDDLAAAVESS